MNHKNTCLVLLIVDAILRYQLFLPIDMAEENRCSRPA